MAIYPISKYRLVHKRADKSEDNVINLKAGPRAFRYAAYAAKLLFDGKFSEVSLNAAGQATNKVIQTVEILRNRINGLHVAYEIKTTEFQDEYRPTEEGLETVFITRRIHSLHAHLSLTETEKLKKSVGYMAPYNRTFDEDGFRKKIGEHFEKTKKFQEERAKQIAERKERREAAKGDDSGYVKVGQPRENRDEPRFHRPQSRKHWREESRGRSARRYEGDRERRHWDDRRKDYDGEDRRRPSRGRDTRPPRDEYADDRRPRPRQDRDERERRPEHRERREEPRGRPERHYREESRDRERPPRRYNREDDHHVEDRARVRPHSRHRNDDGDRRPYPARGDRDFREDREERTGGRPYNRGNDERFGQNRGYNRSDSRGRSWRHQTRPQDEESDHNQPPRTGNFRGNTETPFQTRPQPGQRPPNREGSDRNGPRSDKDAAAKGRFRERPQ